MPSNHNAPFFLVFLAFFFLFPTPDQYFGLFVLLLFFSPIFLQLFAHYFTSISFLITYRIYHSIISETSLDFCPPVSMKRPFFYRLKQNLGGYKTMLVFPW
jgi:hypothetical protein